MISWNVPMINSIHSTGRNCATAIFAGIRATANSAATAAATAST